MRGAVIKAIGDFAEVVTGGTPSTSNPEYWDGDVPWLNSGSLNEGVITAPSKFITRVGLANSSAKLMPKDTVLVALTGATTGQVGYLAIEAAANQSVTGILPSNEHHPKYLYFFLKSQRQKMLGDAFGGAQPHINQKYVRDFKIPLPPLDDQIRIAHLLGKVEGLIAQRKRHMKQLDDLLKSVFLEMFGDPVRNEKEWETGTSAIYADLVTVGVVVKPASHYVGRGVVALRSLNIKPNRIDLSDLVYFSKASSDGPLSKSRLRANDVVIVRTGKTGTAAVIPAALDGANCIDLIVVRPKPAKIHPQFLTCLLNSERGMALVSSLEVGGIQKHFNVGALNKIPFPLPPISLQDQFADTVKKIEDVKFRYQTSLTDLEALYGALTQKAFKGELDYSRVPLAESITGVLNAQLEDVTVTATGEIGAPPPAINLPDIEDMPQAVTTDEGRERILKMWLASYATQLKGSAFSVNDFLRAAQVRMSELNPDDHFELGLAEYEHLKKWLFESLRSGRLSQLYNDPANRVQIVAAES